MGFGRNFKERFLDIDQFSSPYLLRFNDSESHSTLTGAVVSSLHYIIYIVIFVYLMNKTWNREIIKSKMCTNNYSDPLKSTIRWSPKNGSMFAVGITGVDFKSSVRSFDVYLKYVVSKNGSRTYYSKPLSPCKK